MLIEQLILECRVSQRAKLLPCQLQRQLKWRWLAAVTVVIQIQLLYHQRVLQRANEINLNLNLKSLTKMKEI